MNYADQPLSELAIKIPMATQIFRGHRLDFCCGGKQTLKDACQNKNINLETIITELKNLDHASTRSEENRSLSELTAFIITRYHQDLRRRFPELITLSKKVEVVHAAHPENPRGLTELLEKFHEEMLMHMMKEENVLFPLIDSGRGSMALMPVKVMTAEHDSHGRELDAIHVITSNMTPPSDACTTWRSLYIGLKKLEEELMDHIHLENNILFPKALTKQGA